MDYFTATTVRVDTFVYGARNSEEFSRAHGRSGAGGLLRGHPKMTSYEITVERGPEVRGAG